MASSSSEAPRTVATFATVLKGSLRFVALDSRKHRRGAKVAAMRKAGHDSTARPKLSGAATASQQRKAAFAWRDDGSLDGVDFWRYILPKLQGLPARVVAEAMGATISHGSKVRSGKVIPHRRHWDALAELGRRLNGPGGDRSMNRRAPLE